MGRTKHQKWGLLAHHDIVYENVDTFVHCVRNKTRKYQL